MDDEKYLEYVNSNVSKIALCVDKKFEELKGEIRNKLIIKLRECLSPIPEHYIWKSDGCSYDHSGYLDEDGYVSLNQSVNNFLQNEYTGSKRATYESGVGWHYCTYDDDLQCDCINIAADIMFSTIRDCIEKYFCIKFSDEEFEYIQDDGFDEIYDNCIANQFFYVTPAMDFVGIGDMLLSDIVKQN